MKKTLLKKNIKYVAAYARYSTDMQTENSILYQMNAIRDYCVQNDYTIVKEYADEACTGTNMDRASFQNLCLGAQQHAFDAVVIYDITRGSRDVADWFSFRKAMMLLNIEVLSVEDKLGDLMDPNDFLIELLGIGIGQHHVLTTRQKSIAGITARAKEGVFMGGCAPLGYDIVGQEYLVNEEEAKIVQQIFRMYADGSSYGEILKALDGKKTKKGGSFSKTGLYAMLKNDRYVGIYTWNRHKVKIMGKWAGGGPNENIVQINDRIPQIVDNETFYKVQERLKSGHTGMNSAKHTYLLTGLIKCASCGSSYCGFTNRNSRGVETRYYACVNRKNKHECDSPNINADVIEGIVIDQLNAYLKKYQSTMADYVYDSLQSSGGCAKEKMQLSEVGRKINNITQSIMNGVSYPELMDQMSALQEEKKELQKKILASNNTVSKEYIEKFIKDKISHTDNIKSLIKTFVVGIKVHPDKSFTLNLGVVTFAHSESPQYFIVTTIICN